LTEQTKARWKAIGWTVAFFVCSIVLTFGVGMVSGRIYPPPYSTIQRLAVGVAAQLIGFGLATWLVGIRVMKRSWTDLRYCGTGNAGKGFAVGFGIGTLPALLAMAIAIPAGQAAWSFDGGTGAEWGGTVLSLAILLVPAALSEEILFRGLGYVELSKVFGRFGSAIPLSLLFGAAHLGNDHVTSLAVANVAVAGLFLSAAIWLPGGIWSATGVHVGWNLTLAALGAPVSGFPFTLPMLDYATGGPNWLTGGNFGPEGGVIATVLIATASILVFERTKQE
jgi:CAAX protease family protein